MPNGVPGSSELSSRKASAFTLDTSVVEAASFRFNEGPLRHLSRQLPPWLQFWIPDIVRMEIAQHRIEHVVRSALQIQSAFQDLQRHIGDEFRQLEPDWLKTVKVNSASIFDNQFETFLRSHNGIVIQPNHALLGTKLFEMYFNGYPPFGGGKDKKHEFPDAASLLMLENLAIEKGVQVIAVSKDLGWSAFAKQSEHIYCVTSLQELTALFVSETPEAKAIKDQLSNLFGNATPNLKRLIQKALENGLGPLPWRIKLPNFYRYSLEVGRVEAKLKSFETRPEAMGVWITSPKNDACVAEMPVEITASLRLEINAFHCDTAGQKIGVTNVQAIIEHQFEAKLQIEVDGVLLGPVSVDWVKNLELGYSPVDVLVKRDQLGPNWIGERIRSDSVLDFDDLNDDIPF